MHAPERFPHVIAAATTVRTSRLALAEAIVTEVGHDNEQPLDMCREIADVLDRHPAAEAVGIATLITYYRTACWARRPDGTYAWAPDTSYSAHAEAAKRMTVEQFGALPAAQRTVDAVRAAAGVRQTHQGTIDTAVAAARRKAVADAKAKAEAERLASLVGPPSALGDLLRRCVEDMAKAADILPRLAEDVREEYITLAEQARDAAQRCLLEASSSQPAVERERAAA